MPRRMFLSLSALLAVALLVAACAPQATPTPTPKPQPTAAPTAVPPTAVPGAKPFRAAMVTDLAGLSTSEETRGFNDLAWDGFLQAQKELGVEIILVESREQPDYEPNLTKLAQEGYDVIVGVGFLLTDAINNVAQKFPNTKFAIIDSYVEQPNVASYNFNEQEGSFLVGAVAAGMSKSGTIGFIGGMEVPLIKKFEVGYIAGARSINPKINVLSGYTGVFNDPGKGKEMALSMNAKNADIIYAAAGSCGLGTIEAAKEKGFYAIGVDTDQDGLAPGSVLTSMLKNVGLGSFEAIKSAKEGTFQGGLHVLGLAAGGVDMSPMKYTKDKVPAELLAKVQQLKQMIIDGKIVVPSTQEELDAFTPPMI